MKRTRQHVMEEESERIFRNTIPSEWIVRKIPSDYGIDYEVEIVESEMVTGKRFWVQLKSRETIVLTLKNHISYSVNTKLLNYALSCDFPLLLVLVDLKTEMIYWLPLQDEITFNLQLKNSNWKNQETNTVYIPKDNNLKQDNTLEGFQWYSLEPARMRAFAMLHHYYHELQYQTRFSGYEIADGHIEHEEELVQSCKIAQHYLTLALTHDVIFGHKGIPLNKALTLPLIEEGIESCKQLLKDISIKHIKFQETAILIGKVFHAINLLSTTISMYQEHRKTFLYEESHEQ